MGFHDLVSASEAASISGVSVATLQRFAEVGYLTIDTDGDGVPMFSKAELNSVFGLDTSASARSSSFSSPAASTSDTATGPAYSNAGPGSVFSSAPLQEPALGPRMQSLFDLLGKSEPAAAKSTPSFYQQPAPSAEQRAPQTESFEMSGSSRPQPVGLNDSEALAVRSLPTFTEPPSLARAVEELSAENRKLRHVVDLQEKILTLRESELRDLKEQRDWLRQRLERLEEKSDRDQLLLLSETQTIRKLISLNEPRKSGFQLALEWIGLKPRTGDQGGHEGTIELRPAPKRTAEQVRQPPPSGGSAPQRSANPGSPQKQPTASAKQAAASAPSAQRPRENRAA